MPEIAVFWLRVATALYAVGLVHSIVFLVRRNQKLFPIALTSFRVAVILHVVAIVEHGRLQGHFPVENFYESLSICALLIALLFLFVHWRYQFSSLAVCLFPLVFLMTQVAAMERPVSSWDDPRVRNFWLLFHVILVLVGYAALLLTAAASVFYLLQERRLKTKSSSAISGKLPPLGTLDDIISRSMGVGFAFITLGVITGLAWAFIESGTRWIGEPKITISLATWALILVMIFLRATAGWRGRKAAVLSLAVLGAAALTWAAHVGLRPTLIP